MTIEQELEALRAEVKQTRAALRARKVVLIEYMTDEGWGWNADVIGIHSGESGALVEVLTVARMGSGEARPVLIRPQGFGGTWIVQALRPRYDKADRYYMRDGKVTLVEVDQTGRYHVRSGHWRIRRTEVKP